MVLILIIFDLLDWFWVPSASYRPRVAQWLERPLGVREAGVRSLTASHQRCKNGKFVLLSLALGINELGIQLGGLESV